MTQVKKSYLTYILKWMLLGLCLACLTALLKKSALAYVICFFLGWIFLVAFTTKKPYCNEYLQKFAKKYALTKDDIVHFTNISPQDITDYNGELKVGDSLQFKVIEALEALEPQLQQFSTRQK